MRETRKGNNTSPKRPRRRSAASAQQKRKTPRERGPAGAQPLSPDSSGAAGQAVRGAALCYPLREAPGAITPAPGRRFVAVLFFFGRVVYLPLLGLAWLSYWCLSCKEPPQLV
ncbi:uncharacterized protein LOC144369401 [Ictidomys tridecemlineatus]